MEDKGIEITHPGIVEEVSSDEMKVRILAQSACASCHAKGMCSVADMKEKIIDVEKPTDKNYQKGDTVTLFIKKSKGNMAVFYAYFLPFLLFFALLLVMTSFQDNEGLAAIVSLAILIPYYIIRYRRREKFKKKFTFQVKE